jgi:hypothetical protein
MRFSVYVNDPEVIEHMQAQDNVSEYLRELVRADIGNGEPDAQGDVQVEILAELRLMRQDIAGLSVVRPVEKPQEKAKKGPPAGLARQAARFKQGQRE